MLKSFKGLKRSVSTQKWLKLPQIREKKLSWPSSHRLLAFETMFLTFFCMVAFFFLIFACNTTERDLYCFSLFDLHEFSSKKAFIPSFSDFVWASAPTNLLEKTSTCHKMV